MTRALFLAEVRRLARSPIPWAAAALCLGLRLAATWELLPDMSVEPVGTSGALLLLAAAMMLSAHLAISRDVRGGMGETLAAVPGRAVRRTAAALAASVTVGTGLASAVMAAYLLARQAMGPVAGVFDPFEAIGGVLAVPFAAALGALLGRWAPRPVAVPLAVFLIGAFTWLNGQQSGYGGWFLPVVLFHRPDWPPRPSAEHVVYLVAAVALFAALALLRHGRTWPRLAAAGAAAAVTVTTGTAATAAAPGAEMNTAQLKGPEASFALMGAQVRERFFGPGARRCEKHGPVTYCAYRDYAAWIPEWVSAVDPVMRALPPAERGRFPMVGQLTDSWWHVDGDEEPSVAKFTFMVWGRAGAEDAYRAVLASGIVRSVTGLLPQERTGCDARGQSRAVVALWLLGQAVPPAPPRDRQVQIGSSVFAEERSPLGAIRYGTAELGYARRLLAAPDAKQRIWAHWDTLVKPGTTVEQALPLLGLRPEFAAEPPVGQPCS
ncbi:hypothetical protein ACQP1V_20400 [Microtetraspora malaysiensis]|uniref:hypothetical protein n=1 Tax=Microtetraspora malaysiensis TaxID=161358 RepID=UPI003D8A0106